MTETNRYLTCGVDNTIPLELQLFMWDCVDRLHEPKDYSNASSMTQGNDLGTSEK